MPELNDSEKKLVEAINKKQYNEVKILLNQPDVSVNCVDETGMTPIQHACYHGNLPLVDLLLTLGADVNSNMHKEGYTALMFAALSGSAPVVSRLLEAGAKTSRVNSVNRTAAQMAAFVGQHQVVSIINNFVERDLVDYYTVPDGPKNIVRLPPYLANDVHQLTLLNNIAPVKVCLFLSEHLILVKKYEVVSRVLRLMCERYWKGISGQCVNEVLSFKIHLLASVLQQLGDWLYSASKKQKLRSEESTKYLSDKDMSTKILSYVKFLLKGCDPEGIPEMQERMLRQMMKDYPWLESELFQQTLRHIANQTIGNHPTALHLIMSHINGQQFFRDDDQCSACNQPKAEKRCSRCRSVHYCGPECQTLHWFTHKKFCPKLAKERELAEERERELAEKENKKEDDKTVGDEEDESDENDVDVSNVETTNAAVISDVSCAGDQDTQDMDTRSPLPTENE